MQDALRFPYWPKCNGVGQQRMPVAERGHRAETVASCTYPSNVLYPVHTLDLRPERLPKSGILGLGIPWESQRQLVCGPRP